MAEKTATDNAYAEFGVDATKQDFEFKTLTIWYEFAPILSLFEYAVFTRNPFNGYIIGVDWSAVDILLNREAIYIDPQDFRNWRIALCGYIDAINEYIETSDK